MSMIWAFLDKKRDCQEHENVSFNGIFATSNQPDVTAYISQHAFKSSSIFMLNMALFEACSKQFIKDTGRSTLRPILDLNTSTRCSILCVVRRKRSRWFWKADTYKSTPFTLNELLTKVRSKY